MSCGHPRPWFIDRALTAHGDGQPPALWCPECGSICFPGADGSHTWVAPKHMGDVPLSAPVDTPEGGCCHECGDGHKHCKACGAYVRGTHIEFCSPKCERR